MKKCRTTCEVLTQANDNFLISFPSEFFSPGVKSLSGMMQLNKLMRSSDLHIMTFSLYHLPPCLVPNPWAPQLFECFWSLYLQLHCLIFNERKDIFSVPLLSQTLLQ